MKYLTNLLIFFTFIYRNGKKEDFLKW